MMSKETRCSSFDGSQFYISSFPCYHPSSAIFYLAIFLLSHLCFPAGCFFKNSQHFVFIMYVRSCHMLLDFDYPSNKSQNPFYCPRRSAPLYSSSSTHTPWTHPAPFCAPVAKEFLTNYLAQIGGLALDISLSWIAFPQILSALPPSCHYWLILKIPFLKFTQSKAAPSLLQWFRSTLFSFILLCNKSLLSTRFVTRSTVNFLPLREMPFQ